MNEQDAKLTVQDIEQLCRLYMDCRLTVLEETELQYVLGKYSYSSPCIEEVRRLMGLSVKPEVRKTGKRKSGVLRNRILLRVAASFAVLMVVAVALFSNINIARQSAPGFYMAYSDGKKVSQEQTVRQVKADMEKAEDFLNHIADLEAQEQTMVNNFINQISSEK